MSSSRLIAAAHTRPLLAVAAALACIGTSGAGVSAVQAADVTDGPTQEVSIADLAQSERDAAKEQQAQRQAKVEALIVEAQRAAKAIERAAAAKAEREAEARRIAEEEARRQAAEKAAKLAKELAKQRAAKPKPAAPKPAQPKPATPKPAQGNPGSSKEYAKATMSAKYGWGNDQFVCLAKLWNKESSWNHLAKNPTSGAYGIPQAKPGSKMASAGADWRTNPATQINWGLSYIKGRYGSPCSAWNHSMSRGWY